MDILVPTEDGYWVNENHARISELIREYNPDMELVWIPPDRRFDDAIPYAVRHNPPNAMPYIVFHIKEDELDHRVLGRLYAGDTTKHDVLARIEADDQARLNLQAKIKREKAEERQDFIKSVVGSNKHTFRHNGKIYPK